MSTDRGASALPNRRPDDAGVALVVTLALLVLVTVTVVAFFSRTTANQQIAGGSSQGVMVTTFADGATQEIIAGLQKEMWDVAGQPAAPTTPAGAPTIFPQTSVAGSIPSRVLSSTNLTFPSGSAPDPNATYSQFGNLVKQSLFQKPVYSGGTSTRIPAPASAVSTSTASAGGRLHDGVYWNQAQLVSVANTDTTTLNKYLVPNWIYTNRSNSAPNDPNDSSKQHPTVYVSNSGMEPSTGGVLGPNAIVGRYAYNIYDIGGLLNAGVAGYDKSAPLQPSYGSKDARIVPGYKGSVQMADLSGLNLNGTLTTNGANAGTFPSTPAASPGWQATLPAFRYQQSGSTPFGQLFASGQYGGWLRPFLSVYDPDTIMGSTPPAGSSYLTPTGAVILKNNGFTSRQDLITWVNSRLGGGTNSASWSLPYLTHFSYDTDAPSFTPNASRPRSNVALGTPGGNDSSSALDDLINPSFTAVLDANGYPLLKRRFPLSALALLDNIYPGQVPADLLDSNSTLYKQIQYDFGLVWNATYNCWDYKDVDPGSYTGIKQLRTATNNGANTVPNTRSPNFFELLKAAITAGSLGKQWGAGSFDGDPDNTVGAPRYGSINYQVIQIGANIISQTTSHYCPTAICLNRNGVAPVIYGVKDLPYFYRARLLTLTVDSFKQDGTHYPMYDQIVGKYSLLDAVMVQPELWNPHAPNLLAPTANYPKAFRIVPETTTVVGVTTTSAAPPPPPASSQWKEGTGVANVLGDYNSIGGPYCLPNIGYHSNPTPDAYISFGWDAGNTDLLPKAADATNGSALGSFREPCPLAAPTFPPNIKLDSSPKGPTMAVGYKVAWDKLPNTQIVSQIPTTSQNVIPARFSSPTFGAAPSNTALGFLVAYCCSGPGGTDLTQIKGLSGGPMLLNLQYSPDGGANFYTYDTIQASFPDNQTEAAPPSGVQQSFTGVRTDPRTHRWGLIWTNIPNGQYIYGNPIFTTGKDYDNQAGLTYCPSSNLGTTNYGTSGNSYSLPKAPGWTGTLNMTASPYALQMAWTQVNQPGAPGYYQDPDGIVRRADGAYVNTAAMAVASGSTADATGLPQAMYREAGNSQASAPGINSYDSRPIVLNRPFQSVAELGYVFRDTPWRSLDFFTPESGDNALLDVFCVYGPDPYSYKDTLATETGLVAGKVNLNTRQIPVLAALIQGASTTTVSSSTTASLTVLTADQATKIAQSLVQWTTNTADASQGPLLNPAELVGKYSATGSTKYSGFSSTLTSALAAGTPPLPAPSIVKQQRECVMHALADAGTTRTWNLLIDLVAQTGQLTANPAGLQSFVVNGERHVWVSVALDRVTGKVIRMQVEPVRL